MRFGRLVVLVLAILVVAQPAFAAPLVDVDWVKQRIGKPGYVFLDVRADSAYARGHVPGAVHTRYGADGWRVMKDGVPGMLPPMAALEKLIGGLGISNSDHVVILPGGYSAGEMGVATRIYWTFKVAGHDRLSILDGGMTAYLSNASAPRETASKAPVPQTFTAKFRSQFLATEADVKQALEAKTGLIDARPQDQYLGINKPPPVARHGTIPGAVNVPGLWTTVDNGGQFRASQVLTNLFARAGAPVEGDTVTFCNTGHWASLGWFVQSEILGNGEARMYDGSMSEWTRDAANPVERKAPVNQ